MSQVLLIVDRLADWAPYYPTDRLMAFNDYLSYQGKPNQRVRVINLCTDYSYLAEGYYCSLLAEARHHHVLPSIRVLNDLSNDLLYQLQIPDLSATLNKLLKRKNSEVQSWSINSYFGIADDPLFQPLARLLFERFPCPILTIRLRHQQQWEIEGLQLRTHKELSDEEQTRFANALDVFSEKVWRQPKSKPGARYDLAVLVNDEEQMPPSDRVALNKFIQAGKEQGVAVELIQPADYMRLPEFDALFIRETTAIDHHTYRFAKKAEAEGMVVLDDPTSILRCTNKIYLADLFALHKVPSPRTVILQRSDSSQLAGAAEQLGFPMVIKIPDGAFSRGVVKVRDAEELASKAAELFRETSLLLAQEYLYTDFDWRIGVLNNRPLYACRYYMAKNHWQIYHHQSNNRVKSGGYDTLPTFEVPKAVLQAAMKATQPIGNGLYGVDVKESAGKGYVIEVNDNPSIDSGVEDKYLGKELYNQIIAEFVRRLDQQRSVVDK